MDKYREIYNKDFDSQANSYIEACFEEKCRNMTEGEDILNSWRADKKEFTNYTSTIKMDFQHYSLHDKTHSIAILDAIYMVTGKERIEALCTSDLWLLLEAAYAHDIGMSTTYEELLEMWETAEFKEYVKVCLASDSAENFEIGAIYKKIEDVLHNKSEFLQYSEHRYYDEIEKRYDEILQRESWPIIWERYILLLYTGYIRGRHHEFSKKKINEIKKDVMECEHERMYGVVGEVAFLHGVDFDEIFERLSTTENGFKDETMHPQFAAAMLRLGDLLDMDSNRFNIRMLKHFGIIPLESILHIEKHKSVQHLSYDVTRISAYAKSEELDVCKTVNLWFQMLDKEVKNLICCWNEIVPQELIGCRLNKCDLKVYHQGGLYNSDKSSNFKIDTEKVYNLFIGENIYRTRFEFIREYLQNAMDASKMQLWLNEKQSFEKKALENRNVFDCFGNRIEDFTIKIFMDIKEGENKTKNSEKDTLLICFADKGIGMEADCVSAISNVSTNSWHRRTKYVQELTDMPCWLFPSGGFGIGVQSAFMMTDRIEFKTKAQTEFRGKHIYLENRKNGGRISEHTDEKINAFGTSVKIEIPIIEILKVSQEEKFDLVSELGEENIFDQEKQEEIFQKLIVNYVKRIAEYSMFPIEIRCGKEVPYTIGRSWYIPGKEVHKIKWNNNKELIYQLSNNRLTVLDEEKEALVSYEFASNANKDSQIKFYYHGVSVEEGTEKTNYPFSMHIIYFRQQVKEILKINRDSFRSNYMEEKNQDIRRYYMLFLELWNRLDIKIALNTKRNKTWFLQLLLTDWYENLEKGFIQDNGEFLELQELMPVFILSLNKKFVENPSGDISKELLFDESPYTLKEFQEKLKDAERIFFVRQGSEYISDIRETSKMQLKTFLEKVQDKKTAKSQGVDNLAEDSKYSDVQFLKAFADSDSIIVSDNGMKQLINMWKSESKLLTLELNNVTYCQILMCSRNREQDMQTKTIVYTFESFIKSKLFSSDILGLKDTGDLIGELSCPIILAMKKDSNLRDDALWVNNTVNKRCIIAFEEGRELRRNQIIKDEYIYLILPFTQAAYDKLSEYKVTGKLISYERFKEIIEIDKMIVLYKWVEQYQIRNKKLSVHEIKERYISLTEQMYDICFEQEEDK